MATPRKRKWTTPGEMRKDWEAYKKECDSHTVKQTNFCKRTGEFITGAVTHPVRYTIKGFVSYANMTEQNYYKTYTKDPLFKELTDFMLLECENSARVLFEAGKIPPNLAGLIMGRYGYTTHKNKKTKWSRKRYEL